MLLVVSPVVAGKGTLSWSRKMAFETGLWCYNLLCSILWYWILVKISQYRTSGIAENITSLFLLKTEIWTSWQWKMLQSIVLLASYSQSPLISSQCDLERYMSFIVLLLWFVHSLMHFCQLFHDPSGANFTVLQLIMNSVVNRTTTIVHSRRNFTSADSSVISPAYYLQDILMATHNTCPSFFQYFRPFLNLPMAPTDLPFFHKFHT
jgi:hypothetical protein